MPVVLDVVNFCRHATKENRKEGEMSRQGEGEKERLFDSWMAARGFGQDRVSLYRVDP